MPRQLQYATRLASRWMQVPGAGTGARELYLPWLCEPISWGFHGSTGTPSKAPALPARGAEWEPQPVPSLAQRVPPPSAPCWHGWLEWGPGGTASSCLIPGYRGGSWGSTATASRVWQQPGAHLVLYFTGWLQDQPADQHHASLCTGLRD